MTLCTEEQKMRETADVSLEMIQDRRHWSNIFNLPKTKTINLDLHPAKPFQKQR